MVSTGISFALYEENSSTLGFSVPKDTFNISFLKASTMEKYVITETLFHENFHEIFKQDPVLANTYGVLLADLLFESPGVLSDFGKEVFIQMARKKAGSLATTGEDAFADFVGKYMKGSYSGANAIDTLSKAEKVLREQAKTDPNLTNIGFSKKNAAIVTPIKNEFLAQITGFIMADRYFVEKFLNVSNVDSSVKMFQLVSNLIGNPTIPTNTKILAESVLAEYSDLTKKLQNKMLSLYPNKPSYSNADINEFIRIFTEGKYTTKSALIKAYTTERYSNKEKGEATIALNNIIFVASSYAKAAKNSASVFIALEQELSKLMDGSYFLLTSGFRQTFGALSPVSMKLYFSRVKAFLKLQDALSNGNFFSRVLLDNGMTQTQAGMDLNNKNTTYVVAFFRKTLCTNPRTCRIHH